jgi:hypothetical protein
MIPHKVIRDTYDDHYVHQIQHVELNFYYINIIL